LRAISGAFPTTGRPRGPGGRARVGETAVMERAPRVVYRRICHADHPARPSYSSYMYEGAFEQLPIEPAAVRMIGERALERQIRPARDPWAPAGSRPAEADRVRPSRVRCADAGRLWEGYLSRRRAAGAAAACRPLHDRIRRQPGRIGVPADDRCDCPRQAKPLGLDKLLARVRRHLPHTR
jgi:hypothetical protein